MNNLAETLRAQGDLAGARGLQEQVLDLRRRVLGAEHPNTLLHEQPRRRSGPRATWPAPVAYRSRCSTSAPGPGRGTPGYHVSAFNLFGRPTSRSQRAIVFAQYLAWLLERDPATLGADQRQIRESAHGALLAPPRHGRCAE